MTLHSCPDSNLCAKDLQGCGDCYKDEQREISFFTLKSASHIRNWCPNLHPSETFEHRYVIKYITSLSKHKFIMFWGKIYFKVLS